VPTVSHNSPQSRYTNKNVFRSHLNFTGWHMQLIGTNQPIFSTN